MANKQKQCTLNKHFYKCKYSSIVIFNEKNKHIVNINFSQINTMLFISTAWKRVGQWEASFMKG